MKKVNKTKVIFTFVIILVFFCMAIGIVMKIANEEEQLKIEEIKAKYYIIENDYQYGIIDLEGNIVIDPVYDDINIPNPSKDVFFCTKINENEIEETKILNKENTEILKKYDNVSNIELQSDGEEVQYEKNVLKYKEDGKYGIINYEGKKITSPIYDEIQSVRYRPGQILVKKDGKYGVITTKGKDLIKIKYDNIEGDGYYHSETKYNQTGYITCQRYNDGYKYGYIDNLGKQVLKNEYSEIYRVIEADDIENTYLIARKNGKVGFIKNGKKVLDYVYQSIEYDYINELIKVQKNTNYGVYNINGEEILPMKFTEVSFRGKYIYTQKEQNIEYYTLNGQKVESLNYLSVNQTDNEEYYTCINSDGLYGILDKSENILVENEYEYLEYLYGDYFIAIEEEKLGVINSNNDIMVSFEYDTINKIEDSKIIIASTNDGKANVFKKDFITMEETDNPIVKKREDKIIIYSESNNLYLDKEGNKINAREIFKGNELYTKEENDKWGFENKEGKIIVTCDYEYVTDFNEYGFAGIKKDGKWGTIDSKGNVVIEPSYEIENGILPIFIGKYYTLNEGNEAIFISE